MSKSKNRRKPKQVPVALPQPVAKPKRKGIQETEFLGRFIDPGFVALAVLGFTLTIVSVIALAPSPSDDGWWYLALFAAPTLPMFWSVFAAMHEETELGPQHALVFGRLFGLPFLLSLPMAVVGMIVTFLPPVAAQIAAVRAVEVHMAFPAENGPAAVMVLVLSGLVGGGAAMLGAFLVWLYILVPWAALRQPSDLAAVALFDARLFGTEHGKTVGRAFALLIMLTVAIPSLIVVGAKYMSARQYGETMENFWLFFSEQGRYWGDFAWLLGIVLIPFAVAATTVIWVKMRELSSH